MASFVDTTATGLTGLGWRPERVKTGPFGTAGGR
jgi:hypothetical protein